MRDSYEIHAREMYTLRCTTMRRTSSEIYAYNIHTRGEGPQERYVYRMLLVRAN